MKQLDPNSNGSIAFDVFLDYMTRELTDMDTSDQLLQSFRTIAGDKVSYYEPLFMSAFPKKSLI